VRPLACWDCRFESRRGNGYLSFLSVVCCQVEVSATVRSLVQRNPTESVMSECDRETSTMRRPRPTKAHEPRNEYIEKSLCYHEKYGRELAEFRHFLCLYESNSDKLLAVQNSNVITIWFIPGI
jgi:hypothetical protein